MWTCRFQLCPLLLLLGCWLGCGLSTVEGLKLENVHVPSRALAGADADLFCYFSLENQTLSSLKWFKDGMEFFRYAPKQVHPISLYLVSGVNVDGEISTLNRIHLKNLTEESSGTYRCEVSGAESFRLVSKEADMTVLAGPRSDPQLEGFPSSVTVGDRLEGNCTVPGGLSPVPKLSFYINSIPVDQDDLQAYPTVNATSQRHQEKIGLSLEVEDKHWTRSSSSNFNFLELKCVATMEGIDTMWVKVKIIQESHPTLRRAPLTRRRTISGQRSPTQPSQLLVQEGSQNQSRGVQAQTTDCTGNPSSSQLISRIIELVDFQNKALEKLSNIENQRLETEKEGLSLRRQELTFLRGLQRAPIKST